MSFSEITPPDRDFAAALSQALVRLSVTGYKVGMQWLLVDVATQRLYLLRGELPLAWWPVSTARAGLDARQDSGGTPPGVHRIAEKIGAGLPQGTVFVSREPTGEIWQPGAGEADAGPTAEGDELILTRILTLAGSEPGVNQGPGVDSHARYIYLHGTNDEARIGSPVSHGCVRLANADIGEVFDLVQEGDPVVIV